jgi:hypothetical protein
MNLPTTTEMEVYMIWWHGITATKQEEFIVTKEGPIHLFTFEQQVEFGSGLLRQFLKNTAG